MKIKRFISRTYQRFSKWTFEPGPLPDKGIIIGAFHTSYWDGFFMVMALWDLGIPFKFLVKDSLGKGPLGPIIRWLGGISVDRPRNTGMVEGIVSQMADLDQVQLVIAPEGTRKKKDYWKSGFWHIANQSGLPVTLAYIDSNRMVYGWRESIHVSGDMAADMEKIREVYKDAAGFNPENGTPPRLRGEDA
ncbi:1-acyl-sn-glycerol-3-phosphate acyltransferase [Trueperella bialowiezensis]|uniref:1-acylglycerol-3-phosphate O-acyltransferases n=1 Tax=Trueperella bialowiezensis TaxID=312285 RepID=A0A3S4Z5B6_9ACTO|nr:1-acyl-sn-glycerol-3-phosphate acyltransferase [Trueperella bialowiezensis]VEI13297.1 1-acylglycerol-3-phosphate O-acyltransferases [Trueperella bialowiezensis]